MDPTTTSIRPDKRLLAVTTLVAVALLVSVTFASFSGATPALSASVANFCSSPSIGVAVQNEGSSPGVVDVTIDGATTNVEVAPGTTRRVLVPAVEGRTYHLTAVVVGGPVLLDTTVVRDCEGGNDDGGGDDSVDGTDSADGSDDTGTDDGTTTTVPRTTTTVPDTTTTAPTTTMPTTTTTPGTTTTVPGTTTTMPTETTTTMPGNGDGSTTVPANGDDTNENGDLPETGPAVLYVQLLSGLLVLCVGMVLADVGRKRRWL